MTIPVEIEYDNSKIEDFNGLINEAFRSALEFGRKIVVAILEQRDKELAEKRDKKQYRNKGKQQTSVKTILGVIEFKRNVYMDTAAAEGAKYVHLLDKDIGIRKIGQMSEGICQMAAAAVCELPYRGAAKLITEMTGLSISAQGVWNIVQKTGEQQRSVIQRHAELAEENRGSGAIESKILYEENDGIWLKLQGKSRQDHGPSREMKVGIAYDGVLWKIGKDKKKRRELDNKVAYASFDAASAFKRDKEGLVASRYKVDEIELRVQNGDGAPWVQTDDPERISVLDKFHRNKKITECVRDPEFAALIRSLLNGRMIDDALSCIEAQINSVEDEQEKADLQELYSYYSINKNALLGYYDRGIKIPETRLPGIVHHARLGSMEGNVFTLIGNRMKGRRACWSIKGGNHLALLLCAYHTTGFEHLFTDPVLPENNGESESVKKLSAARIPPKTGKGYEYSRRGSLPANSWVDKIFGNIQSSFTDLRLT